MERILRMTAMTVAALAFLAGAPAQQKSIEDFFREFTDDWMRNDPTNATRSRYFTGEDQDRLERQLPPLTLEWKRDRVHRAGKGLAELRKFDRRRLTEIQRISADVMQWHLQTIVDEESYLDFTFLIEQFQGANWLLVQALTVSHPMI